MLVYRVQFGENGEGPYGNPDAGVMSSGDWVCQNEKRVYMDRCPMFQSISFSPYDFASYYYAFDSIKKLKDWFNIFEREKLVNLGFEVFVFKVSKRNVKFCESGKQIVFERDKSEQIRVEPIPL